MLGVYGGLTHTNLMSTESTPARIEARLPVEETGMIRLSIEDQQRFAEALINPPPLAPAMNRAIERHRRPFRPADGDV